MIRMRRLSCLMIGAAAPIAAAALVVASPASAHGFQGIYNFTGGADGGVPPYTLLVQKHERFLGTASAGGANNAGIVFRLAHAESGWAVKPIYNFSDTDGQPGWGVTLANGSIYTNAFYAEVMDGPCGTAIQLKHSHKKWIEVPMHTYVMKQDGCPTGNLTVDRVGDVYGVTQDGGANGWGSIVAFTEYRGSWSETMLYSFQGHSDGGAPYSGLILDNNGNLFGTATAGGNSGCGDGCGTVFELSPSKTGWTYNVIYAFTGGNDGGQPTAGLVFDKAGNLYGAAESYGANGGGTIFELTPSGSSWNFNLLASLAGTGGPVVSLTLDAAGNIYGTNFFDGADKYGSVFELANVGGSWTYTDLHDFTGKSDGGYPGGSVTLDKKGNLFGTAVLGGADNQGLIYEIAK